MPVTGGSGRAAGSDGPLASCCVRKVLSPSDSCVCSPVFGRAFEWASGGVGSRAGALGLIKEKRLLPSDNFQILDSS